MKSILLKNYNLTIPTNINTYIVMDLKYKLRFILYNNSLNTSYFSYLLLSDGLLVNITHNNMWVISTQLNTKFISIEKTLKKISYNFFTNLTCKHKVELSLKTIGYKFQKNKEYLILDMGKSHLIYIKTHSSLLFLIGLKGTYLKLESHNQLYLNSIVVLLRSLCPINPYTGKGIKYVNEKVTLKQSKRESFS